MTPEAFAAAFHPVLSSARDGHRVIDVAITLPKLPRAFDGFTIAQITDVHVGGKITRQFVEEMVREVNAMEPDLVAITGDLVDSPARSNAERVEPLGHLRSRHGSFYVTGNHEYYRGVDAWLEVLRGVGLRVLRNERVEITRGDAAFDLAGIDDHSAHLFGGDHGADLAAALAGRDASRAVVLLAHQPRQVRMAARHGVCLQLSGHTHGGQIWPWHHIVQLQQGGRLAGLYREGGTQLYVSRGVGYWGPTVRFAAPSELTRITLRAV